MSFRLVDLSHPVAPGMPVYPGDPAVAFDPALGLAADGCRVLRLTLGTHTGTHLDAPAHLLETGATLDALGPARLAGPGLVLDLSGPSPSGPAPSGSAAIGPAASGPVAIGLDRLLPLAGRLPWGGWLLLRTGWAARWGEADYFTAHPGLTAEAAAWLARKAGVAGLVGVGVDAPSVDLPPGEGRSGLPAHAALLGDRVLIAENLRGLELLPESGFTFLCLPPALAGADGAPARAVALIPEAAEAPEGPGPAV
ncbi:MAG: cyclase family protein [Desulfovibrionaceae bacterium]